jgi:protein-S-isoprenylcysteine O-methyltransferase Ste14
MSEQLRSLTNDDLAKRAFSGFVKFQIALALMIFLPVWSLAYWQGWLYWLLFGASCVVITLYFLRHDRALIERRMQAGPGAETEPRQKLILTFASVGLIAMYVVSPLDYRFGWSFVPAWLTLVGDALVVLSFYGIFLTFRENAFAAATVRVESEQRVISSGPYAVVRHPMYTAALALFLGTPLALGSLWGLIPAALLCAAIVLRLLDEENYLARNLPGYTDYQRRVRTRLVPGIW